ncbi:CRISPR-associated RAMP protein [Archaeoglobales archaeon ex4484_92]|nr:MAG: CRISPR-associated RAMP protein [Archaeoglobales archaeon ex4484_92]
MNYGDLDIIKVQYLINSEITAITPISIRVGKSVALGGSDNPVIRDANGEPYIPASSLKGCLRAEAERIARSLGEFVCDIMNPESANSELNLKKERNELYTPCVICRIFGGPTIASHLLTEDARPINWRIERVMRVSINRITGAQHHGRLFDCEYVSPGSKFSWNLRVENIEILNSSLESKILRYIFKKLSRGEIQIGGYKSIGYGRIKAEFKRVLETKLIDGEITETDVTEKFKKVIA